jgi:hypothetical protein
MEIHNDLENFKGIIARMARAKWITGTNAATPEQLRLSFTDLGRQRMDKASDTLRRAAPQFFNAEDVSTLSRESVRQLSPADLLLVLAEVGAIAKELQPPPFSDGETTTMYGILLSYARQAAVKDFSPRRY